MISRRGFLKVSSLLGIGLFLNPKAVFPLKSWPQGPIMIVDLDRCIGCEACVVACKAGLDLPKGAFNTKVNIVELDDVTLGPRQAFLPILCNQCVNAPCISACPKGAIYKDQSGIVVTDWEKCDGSGLCIAACPFGARYQDPRFGMKSGKCDFCLERLDKGLLPICVETCPSRARIFGNTHSPHGEFAHYLAHMPLWSLSKNKGHTGRVYYTGNDILSRGEPH